MFSIEESVTCPHCRLTQYLTVTGRCRRCARNLRVSCIEISLPPREILFDSSNGQRLREFVGTLLLKLRRRSGYSQTHFASAVAAGHRARISRIECGHVLPSLTLLLRAIALLKFDGIYLRIRNPGR